MGSPRGDEEKDASVSTSFRPLTEVEQEVLDQLWPNYSREGDMVHYSHFQAHTTTKEIAEQIHEKFDKAYQKISKSIESDTITSKAEKGQQLAFITQILTFAFFGPLGGALASFSVSLFRNLIKDWPEWLVTIEVRQLETAVSSLSEVITQAGIRFLSDRIVKEVEPFEGQLLRLADLSIMHHFNIVLDRIHQEFKKTLYSKFYLSFIIQQEHNNLMSEEKEVTFKELIERVHQRIDEINTQYDEKNLKYSEWLRAASLPLLEGNIAFIYALGIQMVRAELYIELQHSPQQTLALLQKDIHFFKRILDNTDVGGPEVFSVVSGMIEEVAEKRRLGLGLKKVKKVHDSLREFNRSGANLGFQEKLRKELWLGFFVMMTALNNNGGVALVGSFTTEQKLNTLKDILECNPNFVSQENKPGKDYVLLALLENIPLIQDFIGDPEVLKGMKLFLNPGTASRLHISTEFLGWINAISIPTTRMVEENDLISVPVEERFEWVVEKPEDIQARKEQEERFLRIRHLFDTYFYPLPPKIDLGYRNIPYTVLPPKIEYAQQLRQLYHLFTGMAPLLPLGGPRALTSEDITKVLEDIFCEPYQLKDVLPKLPQVLAFLFPDPTINFIIERDYLEKTKTEDNLTALREIIAEYAQNSPIPKKEREIAIRDLFYRFRPYDQVIQELISHFQGSPLLTGDSDQDYKLKLHLFENCVRMGYEKMYGVVAKRKAILDLIPIFTISSRVLDEKNKLSKEVEVHFEEFSEYYKNYLKQLIPDLNWGNPDELLIALGVNNTDVTDTTIINDFLVFGIIWESLEKQGLSPFRLECFSAAQKANAVMQMLQRVQSFRAIPRLKETGLGVEFEEVSGAPYELIELITLLLRDVPAFRKFFNDLKVVTYLDNFLDPYTAVRLAIPDDFLQFLHDKRLMLEQEKDSTSQYCEEYQKSQAYFFSEKNFLARNFSTFPVYRSESLKRDRLFNILFDRDNDAIEPQDTEVLTWVQESDNQSELVKERWYVSYLDKFHQVFTGRDEKLKASDKGVINHFLDPHKKTGATLGEVQRKFAHYFRDTPLLFSENEEIRKVKKALFNDCVAMAFRKNIHLLLKLEEGYLALEEDPLSLRVQGNTENISKEVSRQFEEKTEETIPDDFYELPTLSPTIPHQPDFGPGMEHAFVKSLVNLLEKNESAVVKSVEFKHLVLQLQQKQVGHEDAVLSVLLHNSEQYNRVIAYANSLIEKDVKFKHFQHVENFLQHRYVGIDMPRPSILRALDEEPIEFTEHVGALNSKNGFDNLHVTREEVSHTLLEIFKSDRDHVCDFLKPDVMKALLNHYWRIDGDQDFLNALQQVRESELPEKDFVTKYLNADIIEKYIMQLATDQERLWLDYGSIILYAEAKHISLRIWQRVENAPGILLIKGQVKAEAGIIDLLDTQRESFPTFSILTSSSVLQSKALLPTEVIPFMPFISQDPSSMMPSSVTTIYVPKLSETVIIQNDSSAARVRSGLPRLSIFDTAKMVSQIEFANKEASKAMMKARAEAFGFDSKDVLRDGSCFYYALINQLNKIPEYQAMELQDCLNTIAAYIEYHRDQFEFLISQAHAHLDLDRFVSKIRDMNDDSLWGDHITIMAAAMVFKVNIAILPNQDSAEPIIYKLPDSSESAGIRNIFLGWETGAPGVAAHFQELAKDPDKEDRLTPLIESTTKNIAMLIAEELSILRAGGPA